MATKRELERLAADAVGAMTAKEAGRLLLRHRRDAYRKGKPDADGKKVFEPLDARLAKARGKDDEAKVVSLYNAVVFLDAVLMSVNYGDLVALTLALDSDAQRIAAALLALLREDAFATYLRRLKGQLMDDLSYPVSPEDYADVVAWGRTAALSTFSDVAIWFDGDDDQGDDQVFDDLQNLFDAGELVGGPALTRFGIGTVLVADGRLPAWAALRLTWSSWVIHQGYRVAPHSAINTGAPALVDTIIGDRGDLDDNGLRKLAKTFYTDCRRRPWGKDLVAAPDLDALVAVLIVASNPFLHIKPPDFGTVVFETFAATESDWNPYRQLDDDERVFQLETAVTVESLTRAAAAHGWTHTDFAHYYLEDLFRPSRDPAAARRRLGKMLVSMQPFETGRELSYGWSEAEEGEVSMSALVGIGLLTPLERQVARLQQMIDDRAALGVALDRLAARYFDGDNPLYISAVVDRIDETLEAAKVDLANWVARIKTLPGKAIPTAALTIREPNPSEETIKEFFDLVVEDAAHRSRIKNHRELLP